MTPGPLPWAQAEALEATAHYALEAIRMAEEEVDETQEVDETEFDPARARAALEKRNRENHNLRARLKELEPLAKKAQEADEAAKTEAQKAAEARAAAEKERDEARLALLKRDIAEEAGLPKSWADRLRGSTKDELEADAKELAENLSPQQTSARPVPALKSGALPPGTSASGSPSQAIDAYIRQQAGIQSL